MGSKFGIKSLSEKQEMWLAISAVAGALLIIILCVWASCNMVISAPAVSGAYSIIVEPK